MNKKRLLLVVICGISLKMYAQNSIDEKVKALRQQLTIEEKIDLLCAQAPEISRLNIVKYDWWSEALHGVARAGKATVFPKPIALGCTWDIDLMKRISTAISDEARAKYQKALREKGYTGRQEGLTFFSPTLNIARDPRWGRTSECFSEDPLLTSQFGVAFIRGMQGDDPVYLKTAATAKHFVANNEEDRRLGGSATVDEMSLREYYFPAFHDAVTKGRAASVMSAYNALNGIPCSANKFLLTDVLRTEWGFKGVVISDGSAIDKLYTHHKYVPSPEQGAALALKAGCDMSLRDEYREGLRQAYAKKLVTAEDIDKAVERVLTLRVRLGINAPSEKNPYTRIPDSVVESFNHRQLALEAAQKSMVLLKNENILPIHLKNEQIKKIGLIGEAFKTVYYGDYSGTPEHNTTLFESISAAVAQDARLKWVGEQTKEEPIPSSVLVRSDNQAYDGLLGFTSEYSNSNEITSAPSLVRQDLTLNFTPDKDQQLLSYQRLSARWVTTLVAPVTGNYTIAFSGSGHIKMYLHDSLVINKTSASGTRSVFNVSLNKNGRYAVRIECSDMNVHVPVKLTWRPPFNENDETPEMIAKQSDLVILFIRDDNSSEGKDRKSLSLTAGQIELINKVTQANPNTILLLGGGTALSLTNIINRPKALLNVWIGGQGEAQAISDILFGKVNPSGKLAMTIFANEQQLPPIDNYNVTNGRSYQYFKGDVLFPFGYGLSFTSFQYAAPAVNKLRFSGNEHVVATVKVSNTGDYDGEEVVQCYLSSPDWEKGGLTKKLVGYKRVFIKKGETKPVEFTLSKECFLRWNIQKKDWRLTTHHYAISIVAHSGLKNPVSFYYSDK
jgi:beta-glucosidase